MATVQSPQQFLADFIHLSKNAKKRIFLQSMIFESGKVVTELEPIFIEKAKAGVDVHISTDWIAHRYAGKDVTIIQPLFGSEYKLMRDFQERSKILENKLQRAGATITITNGFNPFSPIFPILKRNHRKIYVIDDTAWIGGINFFDKGFEVMDFMVKFTDPELVTVITEEFQKVTERRPKSNYKVACNDDYEILLDAGLLGKSVIYDEAITLAKRAKKSITFASQFIPDGPLLDALINASGRGVHVTIITDRKEDKGFTTFPYNIPYMLFKKKLKNNKEIHLFHQPGPIHVKLLLVDGENAIFGSHNLVNVGVLLGTAEIAVKTKDERLVKDLEKFIEENAFTNI